MHAAAAGPQAELEHGVPRHRLCLAVVFGSRLDSSVRTLVATQQKKKKDAEYIGGLDRVETNSFF